MIAPSAKTFSVTSLSPRTTSEGTLIASEARTA